MTGQEICKQLVEASAKASGDCPQCKSRLCFCWWVRPDGECAILRGSKLERLATATLGDDDTVVVYGKFPFGDSFEEGRQP